MHTAAVGSSQRSEDERAGSTGSGGRRQGTGAITTDHEQPELDTPGTVVRVVIVDDHVSFAEALRVALGSEADIDVVATAATLRSGEHAVHEHRPDVALVDHRVGDEDGLELVRALHESRPRTRLVMLTATTDDSTILRALEAGCVGYLVKDAPLEAVVDAVRAAARGDAVVPPALLSRLLPRLRDPPQRRSDVLTERELAILDLLDQGRSNAAIAAELTISVNTVRNHVQNVLTKLGAHSKLEAVARARSSGLLGQRR